jgi:hypothetical protein
MGCIHGRSLHIGRRRHQPCAGTAHRPCRSRWRALQLEYRPAHQRVLCILSRTHRRRVRRLPQLRSVPAVRVLRNRHRAQVLPHRHLGIDAARVRSHEAGPLLIRRLRDGTDRPTRRLRDCRQPLDGACATGPREPPVALPDVGFPAGVYRLCRCTPGRQLATSPRPPPHLWCLRASS